MKKLTPLGKILLFLLAFWASIIWFYCHAQDEMRAVRGVVYQNADDGVLVRGKLTK